MDCRDFRKHHLAYLDDTLSGDQMTAAQRHLLACDRCAAHDTLVRRSLLLARNIPTLAPSADFQERLRMRLDECKRQDAMQPAARASHGAFRAPRTLVAVAAGAVLGTMLWHELTPAAPPLVAMQPVVATQPASPEVAYFSPALMQAMATGNPVWPAAMIVEEAPSYFVNAEYSLSADVH